MRLRLEKITLAHRLSLPVGKRIPFGRFMVIGILADFAVVEREYRGKPLGAGTIRDLVAFKMTSFGKGLLESLQA